MNENAKKWVKALRSGRFEQGRGRLCSVGKGGDRRFCCLGVACELAVESGLELDVQDDVPFRHYDGEAFTIPHAVQGWLEMTTTEGLYDTVGRTVVKTLAGANDRGSTFEEIADIIEEHEEVLFG